ncbi:MAG: rod shape-determining protein MreD [Pseudomonadota bacterium]
MASHGSSRPLAMLGSVLVALLLTMMPLPGTIESFRPDWIALVLIFWTMTLPRSYSVGAAWAVGLILDVAQGTLLGQHALALVAIVYVTSRFHLLMRVFPMSQLTLTVLALLALYQFLLFWINGVAGVDARAASYWGPVLSGTLLWPLLAGMLASSGRRRPTRA